MNPVKTTVLVVEDHPLSRIGLRILLSQHDRFAVVAECVDGCDAVKQALSLRPDVILMDIGLPLKDGIQATKEIKALLPDTQVIILSSNNSPEDFLESFAAGASGYCLKSITEPQLLTAIAAASFGATWFHPEIAAHVRSVCQSNSDGNVNSQNVIPVVDFELSDREIEILTLLIAGLNNKQIGERLSVCPKTTKSYLKQLYIKLGVSDRTQAALKALRKGLIKVPA
jgi:DNA-binding NarL/FixJ family response regulator